VVKGVGQLASAVAVAVASSSTGSPVIADDEALVIVK
jgi:hypothetical protein